ncbi:D-3-phosphoglycerate dehydrogenase [Sedimentibacter acidaminivorans]|uniref:D-3-phosphoglycerate dehydrogenase n=1 Tax=Sedimentibacter acidaminivorans TaxID=913099 RepID=A0ABS4GB03_9FIRM|nr:hydroxyacid dehydrogenase [Sedimentibacter acidaminivorans]MBP1924717.1 D-3-phosphoglycerate dehydrogenase [Sedimentibacter acidaminivorans]
MKVLIPQVITETGKNYLLEKGYEIKIGTASDEETIKSEVVDCDAILIRTAKITREIMEASKKLKVIARHGVGVDAIDLQAATELGIQVTNGPLSNFESVSEHTIAFILACGHHLTEMDRKVRGGNWGAREQVKLSEVNNKVLGLIGLGRIGLSVAKKASLGLGMKVIGYSRHAKKEEMPDYIELVGTIDEIFKKSDFVSLHIPATDETINIISMKYFKIMKPEAFLINCARGEIINELDLYDALINNMFKGAALDVMANEPPDKNNPLLKLDNIIFSPHFGAHSIETFDRMGLHAAMGIDEVLSGKKISWPVN